MDLPLLGVKPGESAEAHKIRVCNVLYYEYAYNINEIAKKLNITNTEVFNATHEDKHYLTQEELEEIKRLHKNGENVNEIARKVGVTRDTVVRRMDDEVNAFDEFVNGEPMSDDMLKSIIDMFTVQHKTTKEISKKLGITEHRVRYRLQKCGLYTPRTKRVTKQEIAKFIKYYKNGWSYTAIGKKFGRDRDTVSRYVNA